MKPEERNLILRVARTLEASAKVIPEAERKPGSTYVKLTFDAGQLREFVSRNYRPGTPSPPGDGVPPPPERHDDP